MSYYRGDYYAGDYYAGDPFLGALFRGAGRMLKGAIGAFTGLGAPRAVAAATPSIVPAASGAGMAAIAGRAGELARRAGAIVARHPVISAAGAAGAIGVLTGGVTRGAMGRAALPAGAVPRGYHISKPHAGVPEHLVRNRRMRVTNPRALRRAIRRAHGFARLARRVLSFTSPRAPRGRAIFRRKRAKR